MKRREEDKRRGGEAREVCILEKKKKIGERKYQMCGNVKRRKESRKKEVRYRNAEKRGRGKEEGR